MGRNDSHVYSFLGDSNLRIVCIIYDGKRLIEVRCAQMGTNGIIMPFTSVDRNPDGIIKDNRWIIHYSLLVCDSLSVVVHVDWFKSF